MAGASYPVFNVTNDASVLAGLSKKDQSWVISTAKRSAVIDGSLVYSDEFMDDH